MNHIDCKLIFIQRVKGLFSLQGLYVSYKYANCTVKKKIGILFTERKTDRFSDPVFLTCQIPDFRALHFFMNVVEDVLSKP